MVPVLREGRHDRNLGLEERLVTWLCHRKLCHLGYPASLLKPQVEVMMTAALTL